jgi:hypothetical protein
MLKNFAQRVVGSVKRRSANKYREVTWRSRILPHFIIIGAQKSGTTSLFHYLSQHPQLIRAYKKEIHYFDGGINPSVDTFEKGPAWYRMHFPLERDVRDDQRVFEASPLYIFNPLAPQRMHDLIPEARLIAVLRDPTDRAISQYFHVKRRGFEPLPILEALQAEEERLKPVLEAKAYNDERYRVFSYKSRGVYHEQIKTYLPFFPMSRLLILNSGALFAEPAETLRKVFEFVGVDPDYTVANLKPRNVAANKTDVDPAVYAYLDDYFRPHNEALYELIGQDYGW